MRLASNCENTPPTTISIVKILPKIPLQELFSHKKCYLGISLENPSFEAHSLQALLAWIEQRFEQCLVIVGDHLCRYNERIFGGFDEEQAAKIAHRQGDLFLEKNVPLLQQVDNAKIKLTRWQEHVQNPEFIRSKSCLDDLFDTNDKFRSSIENDATAFLKRQDKHSRTMAMDMKEALKLSCEYLIEEIAVFSSLSEQGWQVELYPGPELRVLAEVAKGKYPGVPRGLKERISVELKIHAVSSHQL